MIARGIVAAVAWLLCTLLRARATGNSPGSAARANSMEILQRALDLATRRRAVWIAEAAAPQRTLACVWALAVALGLALSPSAP